MRARAAMARQPTTTDGNGVNEGGRPKCSDHAGAGNERSNHCTCGESLHSLMLWGQRGAHTPLPLRNQVGSLCEMPRMRASGFGGRRTGFLTSPRSMCVGAAKKLKGNAVEQRIRPGGGWWAREHKSRRKGFDGQWGACECDRRGLV
jgi:hypothetical protein